MNHFLSMARKGLFFVWLIALIWCLAYYLTHPESFTAERLAEYVLYNKEQLIAVYALLFIIRGFALLPSTPLVIAGTIVFQSQPFLVLFISMSGIMASSVMIYYFSDQLGLSSFLGKKYEQKLDKVRERLERPSGLLFLVFWAFFPAVPTDLASYVAGIIRMNFVKFFIAVFIGELILCAVCIFAVNLF
ncbi:MAG: VTT domain-containing protein [Saprospiraceae bacterium]|nr:VTT domain-containing protein [Saprospiraceae bacterium]